jgi:hypothetical protein
MPTSNAFAESRMDVLTEQRKFIQCEAKWAAAKGGVGSGKTVAACVWLFQRMIDYPHAKHVVCGANFGQLTRGFWPSFCEFLEVKLDWHDGVEFDYKLSPSPSIEFTQTGAKLISISAEQRDSIRSLEAQTIYAEEPSTWLPHGAEFFSLLVTRFRASQLTRKLYPGMPLQGRLTFNPDAIGSWLYKLMLQWEKKGWPLFTFNTRDNVLLEGLAEYIEQLETNLPEEKHASEIEGEWRSRVVGAIYRSFNESIHCAPPPEHLPPMRLDPHRSICLSFDFGSIVNASVLAQVHEQYFLPKPYAPTIDGQGMIVVPKRANEQWQEILFYFLDEVFLQDAGIMDVIDLWIAKLRAYGLRRGHTIWLYGDASGNQTSQQISKANEARTNWELVQEGFHNAGFNVVDRPDGANPRIAHRYATFNVRLKNLEGHGVLIDPHKCPNFVEDLRLCKYKECGDGSPDKSDPLRTHSTDAAGYFLHTERPALIPALFRSQPIRLRGGSLFAT